MSMDNDNSVNAVQTPLTLEELHVLLDMITYSITDQKTFAVKKSSKYSSFDDLSDTKFYTETMFVLFDKFVEVLKHFPAK